MAACADLAVRIMAVPPIPRKRPAFVPMGREYVSLSEIARWTGLSLVTLRRHQAKGALATVKVGGRVLVRVDALIDYLGES